LVGKLKQKIQHVRPRHGWEDNNRMDLTETGREAVDWMNLAQDRDKWWVRFNTVMNLWVA
jgi:hypothetical protein